MTVSCFLSRVNLQYFFSENGNVKRNILKVSISPYLLVKVKSSFQSTCPSAPGTLGT